MYFAPKIISEFYLNYPQLRWITFRDMVQMTYEEFSDALKECIASVWIDDESTFGTFPLESMKCEVPVIGKNIDTGLGPVAGKHECCIARIGHTVDGRCLYFF